MGHSPAVGVRAFADLRDGDHRDSRDVGPGEKRKAALIALNYFFFHLDTNPEKGYRRRPLA